MPQKNIKQIEGDEIESISKFLLKKFSDNINNGRLKYKHNFMIKNL